MNALGLYRDVGDGVSQCRRVSVVGDHDGKSGDNLRGAEFGAIGSFELTQKSEGLHGYLRVGLVYEGSYVIAIDGIGHTVETGQFGLFGCLVFRGFDGGTGAGGSGDLGGGDVEAEFADGGVGLDLFALTAVDQYGSEFCFDDGVLDLRTVEGLADDHQGGEAVVIAGAIQLFQEEWE